MSGTFATGEILTAELLAKAFAPLLFEADGVATGNAAVLPSGPTSSRPSVAAQYAIRGNTTLGVLEIFVGSTWYPLTQETGVVPGPVTELASSAVTPSSVSLSWTAPAQGTAPISYSVQYRPSGTTAWTTFTTTSATNADVTNLQAATPYDFQVLAGNAFGTSSSGAYTASTASTSGTVAPSEPIDLTSTATTANSVNLSWTASSQGTSPISYAVQYRITGTSSWTTFVSTQSTSASVTQLQANTSYDFQIVASNQYGSATSIVYTVSTASLPSGTAPNAVTGLTSSGVGTTSLTISWTASTQGTLPITYALQYRVTGTTSWSTYVSTQSTSAQVTGLTANTSYDFQVVASNQYGTATSSVYTVSTSPVPTGVKPGPATGLTGGTPGSTSIAISWQAPTTGTAPITYTLQYQVSGATAWTNAISNTSSTSYTVTGLTANTKYNFQVISTNAYGSSTSATYSATTAGGPGGGSGPPTLTGPASESVNTNSVLTFGNAYTLADPSATGTCTLDIGVASGGAGGTVASTLNGSPVSGSGTNFIALSNTLANCQTILANLTYTAPATAGTDTLTVTFTDNISQKVQTPTTITVNAVAGTLRNWYDNPGEDGRMWVCPFYNSAQFDTTSANAQTIRGSAGSWVVNTLSNYGAPFYIGKATDPTGTVTDGNFSITVHVPAGSTPEQPASGTDSSMGGLDETQPYLIWSGQNCQVDGSYSGQFQQGSTITVGTYFVVGDGSGPFMEDVTVGTTAQNAMGGIGEYELQQAIADSNYIIQHMLCWEFPGQYFNNSHIWPLNANDVGGSGSIPEGTIIGIPPGVAMPSGLSRGGQLLWTNAQQYGWMLYNLADSWNITVVSLSNATASLANDIANSINTLIPHMGILTNQSSAATVKGYTAGATLLYPAPPPLDLSPTGGKNVAPSTFTHYTGWYPSGYNVVPSNTPTGGGSSGGSPGGGGGTPSGGASPSGTIITPGSGTLTDASGNVYSIDSSGNAIENGSDMTGGAGTGSMEYYQGTIYAQDASTGTWYTWNGSAFVAASAPPGGSGSPGGGGGTGGTPAGAFKVSGGKILDSNGNSFIARGININDWAIGGAVSNLTTGAPLTTDFPGINYIRFNANSYWAASTYDSQINALTKLGIVVEIDNHVNFPSNAFSGSALSSETTWIGQVAGHYASNPLVWFGSQNEPQTAPSAEHVAFYNAVRGANNNAPILFDMVGGGNPGTFGPNSGDYVASDYSGMHNVVWDIHYYGWVSNYSTNQSTVTSTLTNNINLQQQIKSADGVIPVIIAEYGNSTDGTNIDANWQQIVTAVTGSGFGSAAWAWAPGGSGDNLFNSISGSGVPAGGLSTYGQMIAAWIKSAAASSPGGGTSGGGSTPRVTAPLTGSVTTGSWTAYDYSPPGVTLASGKPFHFNVLLPAQYSKNVLYPVFIYLPSDYVGDPWYLGQNTNPNFETIAPELPPVNTVAFRTAYPAIVILPYADQTSGGNDGNDAVENWGGWTNNGTTGSGTNYSGDTGPNVFALNALIQNWLPSNISNYDPTRIYVSGFSLGAIGAEYLMLKYNRVNGSPKLYTAGISVAGVLEINGFSAGPTSANYTTMTNVPVWWVSGGQDTTSNPGDWNEPMWQHFAGNSNYPGLNSSAASSQAGSSLYHYWQDPNIGHSYLDENNNLIMGNTTLLNWLFSQEM